MNFQSFEVVFRGSETQLQVTLNWIAQWSKDKDPRPPYSILIINTLLSMNRNGWVKFKERGNSSSVEPNGMPSGESTQQTQNICTMWHQRWICWADVIQMLYTFLVFAAWVYTWYNDVTYFWQCLQSKHKSMFVKSMIKKDKGNINQTSVRLTFIFMNVVKQ